MPQHAPSVHWERKQNITVPRYNEDPYDAASDAMKLLKLRRVKEAIEVQKEAIFRAERSAEDTRPLHERLMALYEVRKRIERKAFLEER
jgi:DNA primase